MDDLSKATKANDSDPSYSEDALVKSEVSQFSSVAGTAMYMAPETKKHFSEGTMPIKYSNSETNLKQDMY